MSSTGRVTVIVRVPTVHQRIGEWKKCIVLWEHWEVCGVLPQENEICSIYCKADNIHTRKTSENVSTHSIQTDFYFIWQLLWTENRVLERFFISYTYIKRILRCKGRSFFWRVWSHRSKSCIMALNLLHYKLLSLSGCYDSYWRKIEKKEIPIAVLNCYL